MSSSSASVPFFKKGKSRPTAQRRRSSSPGPSGNAGSSSLNLDTANSSTPQKSQVILPSRKQGANLLSAGTKRSATQRDDGTYDDERDGPDVKWAAGSSHQHAAQEILDGDEAEEILAKKQRRQKQEGDSDEDRPEDGLYHGQKGYKAHIKKSKEIPKAMRVGPQRSTNTIRTVTIVDYQPDVCKDYKETGYCGFGDTCKFLHDRGTYLAGWQLDNLAANPQKTVDADSSDSDSDEDVPFACLICRNPYTDPVVTRCGHYFCSSCAIKRFAKTPKCLACGAPTGGIFNRAEKILEKLKKRDAAKTGDGEAENEHENGSGNVKLMGLGEEESGSDSDEDSG